MRRKAVGRGAERFMMKLISAKKIKGWTTAYTCSSRLCPNVTGKDQGKESKARRVLVLLWFARHSLKKNLNVPRPFEHLPVSGEKYQNV